MGPDNRGIIRAAGMRFYRRAALGLKRSRNIVVFQQKGCKKIGDFGPAFGHLNGFGKIRGEIAGGGILASFGFRDQNWNTQREKACDGGAAPMIPSDAADSGHLRNSLKQNALLQAPHV